jgi:uroporphyrin-III C-methyltransferase
VRQAEASTPEPEAPIVYLVGAGPGDPELLTLKALRVLQQADVVVFDRLISPELLALIPTGTARIYVGKASGAHACPQDETNALLVRLARAGHRVVRLKGGDPLIFGRGGEEALHLARHGVACEIVPGVTAAAGCAASLGLPLTHRGLASGVRFVAGHCRADRPLDLDWAGLADPATTLVVYMGLAHIAEIACRLIEAGLAADTPAAAVANGTLPDERSMVATLATLADRLQGESVEAPALFVVGRVVEVLAELKELEALRARGGAASSGSAAAPGRARHA